MRIIKLNEFIEEVGWDALLEGARQDDERIAERKRREQPVLSPVAQKLSEHYNGTIYSSLNMECIHNSIHFAYVEKSHEWELQFFHYVPVQFDYYQWEHLGTLSGDIGSEGCSVDIFAENIRAVVYRDLQTVLSTIGYWEEFLEALIESNC